jgi:hypothetical protein
VPLQPSLSSVTEIIAYYISNAEIVERAIKRIYYFEKLKACILS